ncbi:MAG: hypothetical protein LUH12_07270 [Bacteroides sp.]|nr:hypothetical protein [Bacteroides sp.]
MKETEVEFPGWKKVGNFLRKRMKGGLICEDGNSNRHGVGMRRFILFMMGGVMLAAFFFSQYEEEETSLSEKLEKVMKTTKMNMYRDDFYGYTVYYPSFFEQVPDSLMNETGCCQFRFWNGEEITQTAFVLLNSDSLTLRQGMERFARELYADDWCYGDDCFILSGPLYIAGQAIRGHRFHAKYVLRQKLWFVQLLTYPESCTQALARLIQLIDRWQVWEDGKEVILELPQHQPPRTTGRTRMKMFFPWILTN